MTITTTKAKAKARMFSLPAFLMPVLSTMFIITTMTILIPTGWSGEFALVRRRHYTTTTTTFLTTTTTTTTNNKKNNKRRRSSSSSSFSSWSRRATSEANLGTGDWSSRGGRKENEWGIPYSRDLPPLGPPGWDQRRPVPQILPNGGRVTLMGSGPGDPDLLTVSAYRLLTQRQEQRQQKQETVVIADRLVSEEILDLIPPTMEVKVARKLRGCAELAQEEIYWWSYQALNAGKHVIRLKIGDPYVFGRGGEEVLQFRKFGVEAVVVPGVSAAFSAPLLGNIPVTHRGVSNQVVMSTGYGRNGTSPDLIRYHKEQTLVMLMSIGRLHDLCSRLRLDAGYPSDVPVAIVERAGCPDQRTVAGDISDIAEIAQRHKIKPPSTIVIGDVVRVLLQQESSLSSSSSYDMPRGLVQNFTAGV